MGGEPFRKKPADRRVAGVEPARIGAERRQEAALAVGDEAAPAHRPAAHHHLADRMEVAGKLARRAGDGLMAQHESAERELLDDLAADRGRQRPVVVAGDPDPAPAVLQAGERGAVGGDATLRPAAIEAAVATRDPWTPPAGLQRERPRGPPLSR